MKREVIKYGDPVLRRKAEAIEKVDERVSQLACDLLETLQACNGLGLAAQQVGAAVAICVIDVPPELDTGEEDGPRENPDVQMPLILLNPRITEAAGTEIRLEGCLSFPEIFVPVARAAELTAEFEDLGMGKRRLRVRGLLARVVQHELDHLNAVLLVDRMSPLKRISLAGRLKKIRRESLASAKS